jgi:hypothetical protein
MNYSAPTSDEIKDILTWIESSPNAPDNILIKIKKVLSVYNNLTKGVARAKQTLTALRQAMGILPKSEKGSSDKMVSAELDEATQNTINELQQKKDELDLQSRIYKKQIDKLIPPVADHRQLEFDFGPPSEMLFSMPISTREAKDLTPKVERMNEFGTDKGLRVTYDTTKRIDLDVIVTEKTYKVETVEEIKTGKKVRASMIDEGPPQFQMTWKAIANLTKMHVGFAIPINRIELMIGQPEFSSSKICRIFEYMSLQLLPVYLVLADQLADLSLLSGDDTSTKILELDEPAENSLAQKIDDYLGWVSQKANGDGEKKSLNVSFITGKTKADPRSTIRFFRTHTGSVGNLLDQFIELRDPKLKELTFQGDLSGTNIPRLNLKSDFIFNFAGCGAHARRPFWRYREEDPSLCYFMLRGFAMLSQIEQRIDLRGRNAAIILKYRQRYARMVWEALRNRCETALTGKNVSRYPLKFAVQPRLWPTGMDLHKACNYVVKNFAALTLYLSNPKLQYTNNGSERALRIEKCMLSSSKFRKTRKGRAVLDVLRTLNATCTAANIDITIYFKYVFKNFDKLQSAPEELTPFAVAIELQKFETKSK